MPEFPQESIHLSKASFLYKKGFVGFDVYTAESVDGLSSGLLAPCSPADVYQRFRGR